MEILSPVEPEKRGLGTGAGGEVAPHTGPGGADMDSAPELTRQKRWRIENPQSYMAHKIVGAAIRAGRISRPDRCRDCGRGDCRIDLHHPDASKPLLTVPMCRSCHKKLHNRLKQTGRQA